MAATSVLEKVKSLLNLATDDASKEEEARTAALTLARLMRENDLVPVPKTEFEKIQSTVDGMKRELAVAKEQQNGAMVKGAIGGFLAAKFLAGKL